MKDIDLQKTSEEFFNIWFTKLKIELWKGNIQAPKEIFCPVELQFFQSDNHFIIEALGTQSLLYFKKILVRDKINRIKNLTSFILGGPENLDVKNKSALLYLGGFNNHFSGFNFLASTNVNIIQERLRLNEIPQAIQTDLNLPMKLDDDTNYFLFTNCKFFYQVDPLKLYYRRHSFTLIIKKNIKKEALNSYLFNKSKTLFKTGTGDLMGIFYDNFPNDKFREELLSLSNQPVRETQIDAFINSHEKAFARALNYKKAVSHVELKIVDKEGWDKDSLIPDYLMEREDGTFDILDLKKGLVMSSLTMGGKSRRRLNTYCYQLVAQLEGYKRYFQSIENSKWAYENMGIKLNDSPLLIGVIGNQNNFFREEIDEALSIHNKNIILFSYIEVCDLLSMKLKKT